MNRKEFFKKLFLLPFLPFAIKKSLSTKLPSKTLMQSNIFVAGFAYYQGGTCINALKKGDKLFLKAEPKNPHDQNAVEVYYKNIKLGYIPRYENETTSRFLQQNYTLIAEVEKVRPYADSWEKVSFNIWFYP